MVIRLKSVPSLLFVLISSICFSQIKYEEGFYVSRSNDTIHGYIKSKGRKRVPSFIYFKSTLKGDKVKKIKTEDLNEINIKDDVFIRYNLKVDKSSEMTQRVSESRGFNFIEENKFLKIIVENGPAKLYLYDYGGVVKYFYSLNDSPVEQLKYKQYYSSSDQISKNQTYKKTQLNALICGKITQKRINRLSYDYDMLVDLFEDYNSCVVGEISNKEKKRKKGKSRIKFFTGLVLGIGQELNFANSDRVVIGNETPQSGTTTLDKLAFKETLNFGFEYEHIWKFHKRKWASYLSSSYAKYEAEGENNPENKVESSILSLGPGIRHYFYITDKSKIYLNIQLNFNFLLKSRIEYQGIDFSTLLIDPVTNRVFLGEGDLNLDSDFDNSTSALFGLGYDNGLLQIALSFDGAKVLHDRGYRADFSVIKFSVGVDISELSKKIKRN